VERLVQKPSAKTYDQAVQLLSQLREVAARQKQDDIFQQRLKGIYGRYKSRHSLIEKLLAAGLHNT
jgi:ppGpp synthetase/RelA/SpoT-type nucleotidyltranferase